MMEGLWHYLPVSFTFTHLDWFALPLYLFAIFPFFFLACNLYTYLLFLIRLMKKMKKNKIVDEN